MKRRAILPALMISLLLTSCGGAAELEEALETRRDALAAAEELSFVADITANLGGEAFSCTLACTATPRQTELEVLAPELIAGIGATVRAGETFLRYDGMELDVGEAGTKGLGPLSAVPILCGALKSGHIIRAWTEQGEGGAALAAAELYAHDDYTLTVWFSGETLTPLYASLSEDGTELIRCALRDFSYK